MQAQSDTEALEMRAQELATKESQLSQEASRQQALQAELDTGDLQ